MKTINLYLKFHFTSLSPDAQPISLGIVTDTKLNNHYPVGVIGFNKEYARLQAQTHNLNPDDKNECILIYRPEHFCGYIFSEIIQPNGVASYLRKNNLSSDMLSALELAMKSQVVQNEDENLKSFYAEFSDFDISRCDEWVKDNVVGKLNWNDREYEYSPRAWEIEKCLELKEDTQGIKHWLSCFLEQFSNYQIQFILDCGAYNWTHLLKLIAEWDSINIETFNYQETNDGDTNSGYELFLLGLPKLPSNISPVPLDLNDRITFKNRINALEAFNVDRFKMVRADEAKKHHALYDAQVIRDCFNKLI